MNPTKTQVDEFIKILEGMPLGLTSKLKIGENDYALEMVRKMPGNKHATMESIKRHNEDCKQWEEGFADAIKKLKEWRNEQYLKLKNLS